MQEADGAFSKKGGILLGHLAEKGLEVAKWIRHAEKTQAGQGRVFSLLLPLG
jgi:hypothetical protein